ncbi:zinc dependent phospholipase C family protein [Sporosalibacterium faouarense]|uniref:zinc dependent phospholipase C family protein n=1 Tax=Sporosalibacterium faouarense TaxID=516123 RepID=UPI00192C9D1E|nr:zinc dependent phospholipase C family protein [Sporosalibacterium faouarense]
MPDIITHILFGQDMLSKLKDNEFHKNFVDNKGLFILGCQGPDIFFYNDFLPWVKDKRGPKIGKLMHLKNTGEFFIEGLKYIKNKINNSNEKKVLFTYLSGFMCHFALDRKAHPYIYYFTGEYDKNRPDTYKYKGYHKRFELIIDTILLMKKQNKRSYKYKVTDKINAGENLPDSIQKFYNYIIELLYKIEIDSHLANDAYRDMKKVFKLIYDPIGIKKGMLCILEILLNDKGNYCNLTYPRHIEDDIDYMNDLKLQWNHPCDKKDVCNDSFYDIYNKALDDGRRMILNAIEYIQGNKNIEDIVYIFPNTTYTTGRLPENDSVKKYFSPIFD